MKMILGNNTEFLVDAIIDLGDRFEINFKEGVTYVDVHNIFDPASPNFSKSTLRTMTLINEDTNEQEGIHYGYTDVSNISAINNKVVVLVHKENEVATDVELLKHSQNMQDMSILLTQDAIDYILLGGGTAVKSVSFLLERSSNLSEYIAMRVIQKGQISEDLGREHYITFMSHPSYSGYKKEVDTILTERGFENLICNIG